jgi:hypothetical protein
MPAVPPTASVTVGPGGSPVFDPDQTRVQYGGTVTWTWASSGHSVTDTSGLGLFDSGVQNTGATFSYTFIGAGNYYYASTSDPGMTGLVRVPMRINPTTGDTNTVFTLKSATATQHHLVYDVNVRENGGRWWPIYVRPRRLLRTTLGSGTYEFKVRLVINATGTHSGWSPSLTLVVIP